MASELCMNCFSVKGNYEVCPYCGYAEGTPPAQPHYLTPGTILGNHFIVGTVIGVGGFGITYKCFDITLGVIVAVKEFYPIGLVNRSPGERRVGLLPGDKKAQYKQRLGRFLMEAQSVAQFGKAKDIVNVYDYFEENGTAYIIMEYIDGVLLKDYLEKQGPMEPEAALSTIMPIIEAVKKIHSKGIIHRDVSPDNIFIASEDSIKIFDFGAAQLNDTKAGMDAEPVIKVGYSPIEQYRNSNDQGFYTDVYAVGAILYQMLTGVAPVESTEREFKDRLKSPKEAGAKISANVDRAVMEALAVRPELRFQNIQQFQDALQNKRIAEYPKDKLRKKKNRRNAAIGISAVLAAGIGIAIGLYSSVLKPKNKIFDSVIDQKVTINVWVESKEQKKQIENFLPGGFRKGKVEDTDEKLRKMKEENENVEVKITVVKDMEAALQKAKKEKKFPNMFLSDHVTNLENYSLVSLEDNYNLMDLDKYVFMSDYEKEFPGMKEMPTGVDPLLVYVSEFDYQKSNHLGDSEVKAQKISKQSEIRTVELSTLLSTENYMADEEILSTTLANVEINVLGETLILQNEAWESVFAAEENPDKKMLETLSGIQGFHNKAVSPNFKWNSQIDGDGNIAGDGGEKDKIYGTNVLAGVSFRPKVNAALNRTEKTANPVNNCIAYVVTQDKKMLVKYAERYAILAAGSEEQKTACMRLLWCMLQEMGQEKKANSGSTTYPVLRSSFEKFPNYNSGYGDFVELEKLRQPCVLIGAESQQADVFVDGIGTTQDTKELKKYCSTYVKEKGKKEETK